MPLHEVCPAHKGAMLRGSSVVVPEVKINKVDRLENGGPLTKPWVRRPSTRALASETFWLVVCTTASAWV